MFMYNHILIHAPRGGSDPIFKGLAAPHEDFNPRSPWGERHVIGGTTQPSNPFQSTLPVGGATSTLVGQVERAFISIHAPRGGSDCFPPKWSTCDKNFNPRSPWGERHLAVGTAGLNKKISIHAPRGGSDLHYDSLTVSFTTISIHAPRGGSDKSVNSRRVQNLNFNPRSPWGERHPTGH